MRVQRLQLTDFRNYRELDLTLPGGLVIFSGRNAQGKSNLLEAISLIATTRSFRTASDREAVRWDAAGRFARVIGSVQRRQDRLEIEVILAESVDENTPQPGGPNAIAERANATFRKRVRVNGAPRRAMDLVGLAPVVVFAPTDLDLVTGGPADRRRLLDLTLCQTNRQYCRTLSQYQKVVAQRGALLRRIRDKLESPASLDYWDDQLTRLALPLMRERAAFLAQATEVAARIYARLSNADAEPAEPLESDAPPPDLRLVYAPSYQGQLTADDEADRLAMRAALEGVRRRELAQGANVLGPHRDDVAFFDGPIDLATYGSRGQQRSVALALKLAELEYIEMATGEQPILLLDDVLSELDAPRRADLLLAVRDLDQTFVTTADLNVAPGDALTRATVYTVRAGRVTLEKSARTEDLTK